MTNKICFYSQRFTLKNLFFNSSLFCSANNTKHVPKWKLHVNKTASSSLFESKSEHESDDAAVKKLITFSSLQYVQHIKIQFSLNLHSVPVVSVCHRDSNPPASLHTTLSKTQCSSHISMYVSFSINNKKHTKCFNSWENEGKVLLFQLF